jgi:D-sedoheptulose 7-phosphate isomerase
MTVEVENTQDPIVFAGIHVRDYLTTLKETIDNLPIEKMEKFLTLLIDAYDKGSQVFVMGNGGSGATASHFAVDINKGTCYGLEKRFKVICLNDNILSILAYANDVCYEGIFVQQLRNFLHPGDLVIGISGSGNSENVLRAIEYANASGAATFGLTGFDGGKLARVAQESIVVPVHDMQKTEDLALVICHIIMQNLCALLNNDGRNGYEPSFL